MNKQNETPQRVCFVLRIKSGCQQEYIRRHQQVWPEMRRMLHRAGIYNYSLWIQGSNVIGYYETKDLQHTCAVKAASTVQARWNRYMEDILRMDDTGRPVLQNLQQVFLLE